jgi:hypothetical protein
MIKIFNLGVLLCSVFCRVVAKVSHYMEQYLIALVVKKIAPVVKKIAPVVKKIAPAVKKIALVVKEIAPVVKENGMECEYEDDVECWAKNLLTKLKLYSQLSQSDTGAIIFTSGAIMLQHSK